MNKSADSVEPVLAGKPFVEMSFDLPNHVVAQLTQLPKAERDLYTERLFVMALYELEQRRTPADKLVARRL